MYLVDTSVWIDYLRDRDRPHVAFLEELLRDPQIVGISHTIYMEILQGARDMAAYEDLQAYFSGQRFYAFRDPLEGHAMAARIYLNCRLHGITLRSAIDCLIAQCAVESDLILFHHDRDYSRIASVLPELEERHFLP